MRATICRASTLSRTAMTATTTFLSLLALVIFGGTAIEGFALVMLFGVVVCTYSAMFISTPVLLYMDVRSQGAREEAREKAGGKAGAQAHGGGPQRGQTGEKSRPSGSPRSMAR